MLAATPARMPDSFLRISWKFRFEIRMVSLYLLVRLMRLQNGLQQAAGVVGYPQFPFLNQFDTDAAATLAVLCDAAIHFSQASVGVHRATRTSTDCISPAARLGLNVPCRGRRIQTPCEYLSDMSFAFDDCTPEIWNTARDFEVKFLQDLRSAVSIDSYEAVLKAAAAIPLHNVPGTLYTLPQLLSYVTRV